jgi:hypothetical protein
MNKALDELRDMGFSEMQAKRHLKDRKELARRASLKRRGYDGFKDRY